MSKSAHPLDSINITSPCSADWDSMIGNDVVRFCRHCNLDVHDITLMTREEAMALVRKSNGRLCLRYIRRPDGTIQTAAPHQKLHLIKRRASRLVAGAFTATLSVCASVAAQTTSTTDEQVASCEVQLKTDSPSANIESGIALLFGVVQDPAQAVVAGATVTLTNQATKIEMRTTTDDEGQYSFPTLAGGNYTLSVDSPGFVRSVIEDINVPQAGERKQDVMLNVGAMSGAIAILPSEPLLKAVVEEDVAALRELIAYGANVNVLDTGYDSTALDEAVSRGNEEMVRILLQAGADVNLKNKRGQTAILYLSEDSTAEILRELLDAGAKVSDRDDDGATPLIKTAAVDNAALVRAVLEAGADVNERNEAGQTALMLAAREDNTENVQLLLNAGANPHMKDNDGWTALKYAEDNSHTDTAALLKSYGAIR